MNIKPKESFCTDKRMASAWSEMSASTVFEGAASAAMLQMVQNLPSPPDLASAASYAYRLEGAKQFLQILMSLTETRPKPEPKTSGNLIQ